MCRLLRLAALVAAFVFLAPIVAALAHDPYTGLKDPVTKSSCCGGADCGILKVEPGTLTGEPDGYRLRLTEEQARRINPVRSGSVDTLIPWERVQDLPKEWGADYRLCLPNYRVPHMAADFYCFWAPPNS